MLPFCAHCGSRTGFAHATGAMCTSCGTPVQFGTDLFCPRCGANVPAGADGTAVYSSKHRATGPRVALLNEEGDIARTFTIERGEAIVGRSDGDLQFATDVYLSPMHAQLSVREGQLWVRDLGSRNGSWVFLDAPCKLQDVTCCSSDRRSSGSGGSATRAPTRRKRTRRDGWAR